MNNKKWNNLLAMIAIPALMFLYFNQVANWHYHITTEGFIVEHAHPFTNNTLPDTPFQDHEHSDAEYLMLAQMMQSIGVVVFVLLLLGILFRPAKNPAVITPVPLLAGIDPGTITPRGPPEYHRY